MANEAISFQSPGRISSGSADSILAGIWRQILNDLKVDNALLSDRINKYAERVTKSCPDKLPQVRGNLRTDVGKTTMTWFTLTKNLRVLDMSFISIKMTCRHVHRNSEHLLGERLTDPDPEFLDLDEDKDNRTEPNTLSLFLQDVLRNLGVGVIMFEELLNRFLQRNKLDLNARNRTNVRGYLKKDFYAPRMTWKTIIKAMNFLCVTIIEFDITLTSRKGRVTKHRYVAQISNIEDFAEELKTGRGL